MVKNFQDIFDMIHERDRRTDRQADGRTQTLHDSIDHTGTASRGKNAWQHVPVYLQQFPSYSNRMKCQQEAQLSLTNRSMLFCKVVEVLQDVLSD